MGPSTFRLDHSTSAGGAVEGSQAQTPQAVQRLDWFFKNGVL